MSDFLVWMSPLSIPSGVRNRFFWPVDGRIGLRRSTRTGLGAQFDDAGGVAVIGHSRGRRGLRRRDSPQTVARRLAENIKTDGIDALDGELGTIAGVHLDASSNRIDVWRDRFGRHPLQMIRLRSGWAITSSPRTASLLCDIAPRWSHTAAYVCGLNSTTDADVFEDLFRIRPAERVVFDRDHLTARRRWWQPETRQLDEPVVQFRTLLDRIGRHFGERPHHLAISGGLDSASFAAVGTTRNPASTAFTFTDGKTSGDEPRIAARVADELSLDWRPFPISDHWPMSRLGDHRFPASWGPPGHPDFAWKRPCHRWLRTRRFDRPVVYGNGADEALWWPPRLWLQTRWLRGDWKALSRAREHYSLRAWIGAALRNYAPQLTHHCRRFALARPTERYSWERPEDWIKSRPANEIPPIRNCPIEQFRALRIWRLHTWRWERVMRSLAFEARLREQPVWTPFLDAELWEIALSLPPEQLVRNGLQKSILRRATADVLPEFVRQRPKSGGFDPVVERGLADRGAAVIVDLLGSSELARCSEFDQGEFAAAYEAYRRGPDPSDGRSIRGSWPIWKTVSTELWLRYCDSARHRLGLTGREISTSQSRV